ncbi:NACHT, LRR and PYD domains-containing protein 12-like [Labeo rohita]|uniref:NACHT, LRR and PYD domains-containing protein 12-like n=1 Tax=Labeo rohita TaxID=84645 RepID=UPI0021E2E69F|nr:NACHT, LRR and PYD domains-containing protein 12-like [Labeo rohita]
MDQLKDKNSSLYQGFDQEGSDSPSPSVLSMKSDRSMQMPIQLRNKTHLPHLSLEEKSYSSGPSVLSMKSDRSMQIPIQLKNGSVPMEKSLAEKSDSSGPSVLSMKSDRSMQIPIQLKNGSAPLDKCLEEKSDSSGPSILSMKSDRSKQIPIQLKNGSAPMVKRDLHSKSHQDAEKTCNSPGRIMEYQFDSETVEAKVQRLKSEIKKKDLYIFEGFTKQGNSTLLNQIYTELYITEGGNGEISNEHEVKRIEKYLRAAAGATMAIKCSDTFRPLPEQDKPIRTVLTKGVAGIGKTVSVQKFILDWAEGKENQDIQLVFPLPFRELNLMKGKTLSLSDLLYVFFPETKEMKISSDTYKVLFIFDGLDECRLSLDFQSDVRMCDVYESNLVDVLLTNLIVGNLLPSALIWITSRPAAADLVPSECVHRVTEVRGFNDPQKEEYFRKRISNQSLANRIISHLKSSRSLYIMCHIPVFCWISATVLEKMLSQAESGEIPKTLTQMYTHFLMAQISIKDTKYNEKKSKDKEMIFKLGKLAYEQLDRGNLIFYEEDLRECGIDVTEASVYSGLCTQIFREESGLYQGKVFCFVHLSIQEHLAALYVHLSFYNSRINVLEAHESGAPVTMLSLHKCAVEKNLQSMKGYLDLFLRFLMGLSLESNHSLLKGLLVKKTDSSLEREKTIEYLKQKIKTIPCSEMAFVLFHCLNELNDHSLITEIQNYLTSGKTNSDTLFPHQWSALVYILLTSNEKFNVFELGKYGRSDTAVFWLLPVIKLSKKIWMHDCNITEKGCAMLSAVLPSISNLRELDLSHNNLQDSGVEILCIGLKRSRYNLKQIVRSLGSDDCNPDLVFVVLPTAGLEDKKCRLETLNLKNCGVTEAGCDFLSSALSLNPSHLKVLDLSWNDIGDSGVKHLCAALVKTQCALETLKLSTCKIKAEGFESLALALRSNSQLKELDLGNNKPGDQGVELLSAVLHHPHCRLKTLRLDKCGITEKSCTALASALGSKTCSLTDLDLSINDLQDSGMKKLCVGLQNTYCKLEKLRLSNCNVTHEGVTALTKALKSNPSHLKEFDLLENDLEESDLNVLSMILDTSSHKLKK